MPSRCAAFGCNSCQVKGCGISLFSFPKDPLIRKKWHHYTQRRFELKSHHKLCSKHFTKAMFDRDPELLSQMGYPNALPKMKDGAVPDIPLEIEDYIGSPVLQQQQQNQQPSLRTAFGKRRWTEMPGSSTRHCYAVGCTNGDYGLVKWSKKRCDTHGVDNGVTPCDCPPPFELHLFPTKKMYPKKRERWIQAFQRADPNNPHLLLQPCKGHRVCSAHFVDGKPTPDHPDPELRLIHTGRRGKNGKKQHVSWVHRQDAKSVELSPKTGDNFQESSVLDRQDAKSVELSPKTGDNFQESSVLDRQDVNSVKLSPQTGEVPEIPQTSLPVQVFINNHFHQATESKTVTVAVILLP